VGKNKTIGFIEKIGENGVSFGTTIACYNAAKAQIY